MSDDVIDGTGTPRSRFALATAALATYMGVSIITMPYYPEPFGHAMFILFMAVYWFAFGAWMDIATEYKRTRGGGNGV